MKTQKLQIAIMSATLFVAVQARASLEVFDISFTDSTIANAAAGVIDVNMLNGLAQSGTLTVLDGAAAGTYNLISDHGNVAGTYISPSGAFQYDNTIQGIPPGPPSNPYLDYYGLAFSKGSGLTYTEVNIWGNVPSIGGDEYTFYGYTAGGGYAPTVTGGAAISDVGPVPVPEATTILAGAMLLLPFGASTLRILRRNRMA